MKYLFIYLFIFQFVLLDLFIDVNGQVFTGVYGDWNAQSSWQNSVIPTQGSTVTINNSGTCNIPFGYNATASSILVNSNSYLDILGRLKAQSLQLNNGNIDFTNSGYANINTITVSSINSWFLIRDQTILEVSQFTGTGAIQTYTSGIIKASNLTLANSEIILQSFNNQFGSLNLDKTSFDITNGGFDVSGNTLFQNNVELSLTGSAISFNYFTLSKTSSITATGSNVTFNSRIISRDLMSFTNSNVSIFLDDPTQEHVLLTTEISSGTFVKKGASSMNFYGLLTSFAATFYFTDTTFRCLNGDHTSGNLYFYNSIYYHTGSLTTSSTKWYINDNSNIYWTGSTGSTTSTIELKSSRLQISNLEDSGSTTIEGSNSYIDFTSNNLQINNNIYTITIYNHSTLNVLNSKLTVDMDMYLSNSIINISPTSLLSTSTLTLSNSTINIYSLSKSPITISNQITYDGPLKISIDSILLDNRTLSNTVNGSVIVVPLASYPFYVGSPTIVIANIINLSTGFTLLNLNGVCTIGFNQTAPGARLKISNCRVVIQPIECKGEPLCGGTDKGVCTDDGCKCIDPWTGTDCSSKRIIINPPITNTTDPSTTIELPNGDDVSFKSMINIVEIRELDHLNNVLHRYEINEWIFTNQSSSNSTKFLYTANFTKLNQIETNVSVVIQWFPVSTLIKFAGQNIQMNPSTIKYNIELSKYPFSSPINQLEIVVSGSVDTIGNENDKEICYYQEFNTAPGSNSVFEYIKLQMNSVSLYGRFIKRGIFDGITLSVSNRILPSNDDKSNIANIGILIPSYSLYAQLDPDFSLLLDSSPASSKEEASCTSKSSKKGLTTTQLVGIIVGSVCFLVAATAIVAYIVIKKKKYKLFQKKLSTLGQSR